MPSSVKRLLLLAALAFAALPGYAQSTATPAYKNPALPIGDRVEDLLGRMTLEEKVAQMLCLYPEKAQSYDAQKRFDPARAEASGVFKNGIGRIERPSDDHGVRAEAEYTNAVQRFMTEKTRLGIPVLFHEEALHGLQGPDATSFPQAIALASTWDPDLAQRIFSVVAHEIRARGGHQVLAPVVDVAREPRWGRSEETYGEDPYLTARMGVAAVRGFQGVGGPHVERIGEQHVIATLKHMAGHGQPESGYNVAPANYSERVMREVFFYPFERAVKEAGALSLMASYNEVNGVPSHANTWMLRDVLRGEWGFDGTIVSDWNAIEQLMKLHHVVGTKEEAARTALEATVDIELPGIETYDTLVNAVRSGRVREEQIDAAVRRLLRAKFMLGLFEQPYVDVDRAEAVSRTPEHRALALEAAQKAIILLKNERNTLPLDRTKLRSIAVIGPHAAETLLGGYSGTPYTTVSVLDGIRAKVGAGVAVRYAEGVRLTEDSTFTRDPQPHLSGERSIKRWQTDRVVAASPASNAARIRQAVQTARQSDAVVLVLGENEMLSREAWAQNHLGDRTSLDLFGQQNDLVEAVLATGKPVVVLLLNGRALALHYVAQNVPAILEGWYLGQETGTAVADVLFGDVNPGGKLTVTFPRSAGHLPAYYNHKPSARRGYLFDDMTPLFPFGHGLSYTTFSYGKPTVQPAQIHPDGSATVTVAVTNTGKTAGDEVVQLYIRDAVSAVTRPVKELKDFRRIRLDPGQTQQVTFRVTADKLEYFGPNMERVVEPGAFEIMVGGSSAQTQSATLEVIP